MLRKLNLYADRGHPNPWMFNKTHIVYCGNR